MLQAVCDPAPTGEGELGHDGAPGRLHRGVASQQLEQKLQFPSDAPQIGSFLNPREPPHHLQNEARFTSLITKVLQNLAQPCF